MIVYGAHAVFEALRAGRATRLSLVARPGAAPPATHDSVPAGRENPDPRGAASREIGGRDGPDPTRYGDWEKAGRCIDF